jgi:hypothetical protein
LQNVHLTLELRGHPEIVRILESDIATVRLLDAAISRRAWSAIMLSDYTDAAPVLPEQVRRPICRAIINNYNFQISIRLGENTIERTANDGGAIESRNYDADQRA